MSTRGDALSMIARLVVDQAFPGVPANLRPRFIELRRKQLATAVAVAMAESGGNTTARAYNYRDRMGVKRASSTPPAPGTYQVGSLSVDRGLWQLNSRWHPEVSDTMADDPVIATREAFRISAGFTSWRPWATYNNGAYRRWLTAAEAAVTETAAKQEQYDASHPGGITGVVAGVGGVLNSAGHAALAVPDFLARLADPHTWLRVVQVVAGLGAVVLGTLLLTHDLAGSALRTVTGTGKGAVIGAAAAKTATAAL